MPTCDVGADQLLGLYAHLRERGGKITKAERETAELEGRKPGRKAVGDPTERIPRRQRPKHTAKNQVDRFWTPDQAKLFLQARADHRLYPLWATEIDAHVIPGQDGDAAAAIGDAIYGATGTDDAQP